jgi:lipopolysaccharide transport system ATP-binding protein
MLSDPIVKAENLGKCFEIYNKPQDRVKQFFATKNTKHYREFWALKNASFTIERGEAVGIIGKNGSGKSTLLQLICGTLSPTHGRITTNGRFAALLELGSGFNPEFTGRENVFMNAELLGLSRAETSTRLNSIEAFAEINDFIDQPVKTYSSGMMVRLAFAVIAHVDADVLVIDEALSVGDIFFAQKCMRFLRDFMKKGTLIFVSHDSAAVINLCKRAIWLHKGSILMDDTPNLVSNAYLAARYSSETPHESLSHINAIKDNSNEVREFENEIDANLTKIEEGGIKNQINVFSFQESAKSFGIGGAKIKSIELLDSQNNLMVHIKGGDYVSIRIIVSSYRDIRHPIVGFFVKDRLGQVIFGENSYNHYKNLNLNLLSGQDLSAVFSFRMPILPKGTYAVDVAIASGNDLEHEQIEWKHDVMAFESISSSTSTGLVGVPMRSISININGA